MSWRTIMNATSATQASQNSHNEEVICQIENCEDRKATISPGRSDVEDNLDLKDFYNERAAIAEYEGELSRVEAEARALEWCISRWYEFNPPIQADPATCIFCDQPNHGFTGGAILVGKVGNQVWIHNKCHADWFKQRRQQAISEMPSFENSKGNNYDG